MIKKLKPKKSIKSNLTKKTGGSSLRSVGDEWNKVKSKLDTCTIVSKEGEGTGYIINTDEQLKAFSKRLMKEQDIFFDCEFTNLSCRAQGKADLVGFSISFGDDDDDYYVPTGHIYDDTPQCSIQAIIRALKPIWEDVKKRFYGWNIK